MTVCNYNFQKLSIWQRNHSYDDCGPHTMLPLWVWSKVCFIFYLDLSRFLYL